MKNDCSYHEELLHWIWENRQLCGQPLLTREHQKVVVTSPGSPNPTDGPDFINAQITIDNLVWHGDVEIHWKAENWFQHGHHIDDNYNSVILHVVFEDDKESSAANMQAPPLPTLYMKPYLKKPLRYFFKQYRFNETLPCQENLRTISDEVITRQIDKAHRLYFEQKVDDLLRFYDPELNPSEAWKKLVVIALFDGLGIAHNRDSMRALASGLLDMSRPPSTLKALKKAAFEQAGLAKNKTNGAMRWNRKGSRPQNRPEIRIAQGCEILWFIRRAAFKNWFYPDVKYTYERCIENITCNPGLGKERAGVLFGTVWLPAVYLLGQLFGSKKLAVNARQLWLNYRTSLPDSIIKPFIRADIPPSAFHNKLGAIHQLRNWCSQRQCHRCKVFKSAISA